MDSEVLLTIISITCFICLMLESKVAWIAHVSGVCVLIMVALVLSTLGAIPREHGLYDFFTGPTVPIALALMVLSLDVREFFRMPKTLIFIYFVGILSTLIATVISVLVVGKDLGSDTALLAAQFTASYIGGGENAVAMQKILNIPNTVFVAGFAVDNLLTSAWMVATILFAKSAVVENFKPSKEGPSVTQRNSEGATNIIDILISISAALLAHGLAKFLAATIGLLHPLLYLTAIAFAIGHLPVVRERVVPSYLLGSLLFAPFFFSIGAISDLRALVGLSWKVALMPTIIVGVHGILIYLVGYLCRIPSLETSLASQSQIGGPSTAVALAQVKNWRSGISLGLITGITGYATANYFGVMMYHVSLWILKWMSS